MIFTFLKFIDMFSQKRGHMLHGVLLIALFSCAAFYIGSAKVFTTLSISPLIIGIILGMIYANLLRMHLPETWVPGIQFCSKRLLRIGIILYGFRLTFQDIAAVGVAGITVDAIIVTVTIIGGYFFGSRVLKMDKDTAMLTSVGSGVCGAAAVLGAEATMRSKPYKTAVAVATVVIFGTVAMFVYPAAYRSGVLDLTPTEMGIFGGSTLHEVAHAVGAGNALGDDIASTTVIVKMIRVMMLVPVLLLLGVWAARRARGEAGAEGGKGKVAVPWFAFGFLAVIGLNSLSVYLNTLPTPLGIPSWGSDLINYVDTFLLTMAMVALGAETSFDKFKKAGAKPFVLAGVLFVWLIGGGYVLAKYLAPALM